MARIGAFIMLVLYLCTSTECYQLLKLPVLVNHFITHCSSEPSTTLVGFLEEHYADEMVLDADWQDDMKLPFKTCEHTGGLVFITLKSESISLKTPFITETTAAFTPKLPYWKESLQVCDIFQPPRNRNHI